jgi:hypothetical protein
MKTLLFLPLYKRVNKPGEDECLAECLTVNKQWIEESHAAIWLRARKMVIGKN